MNELDENQSNVKSEDPPSVVLSEAEFFDEISKRAAMEKLIQTSDGNERRVLVRPHISITRMLLNIFVPLAVWCGIFCALYFTLPENSTAIALGVSFGVLGLYIFIRMRAILIWSVKVYQRLAPDETRLRCVYTPSCSEYAIQALEKYGVLRGVPRIISRLKRCHPPNGGDDPLA